MPKGQPPQLPEGIPIKGGLAEWLNANWHPHIKEVVGDKVNIGVDDHPGAWLVKGLGAANTKQDRLRDVFAVLVSQTGGTPGAWTYTVNDLDGNELETDVDPVTSPHAFKRCGATSMVAATEGLACYVTSGGTPVLSVRWLNETGLGLTFAVNVSQTGGDGGDATTAASFTYTVTDLAGNSLATGASPAMARAVGLTTAATHGTGYWSAPETFVLLWVDEIPETIDECEE